MSNEAVRADLVVTTVGAPATGTGGQSLSLSYLVTNQGTGATLTGVWKDRVYLSLDDTFNGGDILLAERCVKAGAVVIGPTGKPFTAASIGAAVAGRAFAEERRAFSVELGSTGGPPPFSTRDRSAFLSALDAAIVRLQRGR